MPVEDALLIDVVKLVLKKRFVLLKIYMLLLIKQSVLIADYVQKLVHMVQLKIELDLVKNPVEIMLFHFINICNFINNFNLFKVCFYTLYNSTSYSS